MYEQDLGIVYALDLYLFFCTFVVFYRREALELELGRHGLGRGGGEVLI